MNRGLVAKIADFVTRRRALVLTSVGALTLIAIAGIPRLHVESSPENMVISFGDYEERVRAFRSRFGDTDNVMMLLVEADDATSLPALRYQHLLARHFASEPEVLRVDGLTVTPLPRGRAVGDDGVEIDESAESLADLDTVDAEPEGDPGVEQALATLVASAPVQFPSGLYDVAERVSDADREPVVRGDEVTERDVRIVRAAIADAPLVVGRLVSDDRTLGAVVVQLREEIGTGNERVAFVDRVDAWLDANPPPAGVSLHRAGLPHLRTAIVRYMMRDQRVLVPVTVLICALLLFASFRWLPAMVLPLITVGVGVAVVIGAMAWAGEPLTILSNVLPTLLIIIGLSNAIHLISRWREELVRLKRPDSREAAARALRSIAVACFLTSFTDAVGLGALMVSRTEMLRRFGAIAGVGVMTVYVLAMLIVPALLTYLRPPRDAGGAAEGARDGAPNAEPRAAEPREGERSTGWIERATVLGSRAFLRRPWVVLVAAALVAAPALYLSRLVKVDTALKDTFEADDPVAISTALMDERMDGIRPLELLLVAEGDRRVTDVEVVHAIVDFERWVAERDGVLRAVAFPDHLLSAWQRLGGFEIPGPEASLREREAAIRAIPLESQAQIDALRTLLSRVQPDPTSFYLVPDGSAAHVELRFGDIGALRSIALIDEIQAEAERRFRPLGVDVSITGEAYIGSRGIESVVTDLVGSLGVSVLLIFFTLALLLRSFRYAALAIPPNALPLLVTMAWMAVRGIPLTAGTAIVFSIAIGIGVDSSIHMLARFREEDAKIASRRAAIVRTARHTGRAIIISALTLVLGFGAFLLSSFVPIQHFGELIATAMSASVVSTLILEPALLILFGGPRPPAPPAEPAPSSG